MRGMPLVFLEYIADTNEMQLGFGIRIIDPDDDYLGIEIRATEHRFAGTTRIYAGLDQLSEFAERIAGFPAGVEDERAFEFGSLDDHVAGGFCRIRLVCIDRAGHAQAEVQIEDDDLQYAQASARFSLRVEPAAIDRFVAELRRIEQARCGEAWLPMTV